MLVQFSGIGIVDARGKLGDSVFFRNRYGAAVRQYAVPVNTITSARSAIRDVYASLTTLWQSLDQWMRDDWTSYAREFVRTTALGHSYYSTGYHQFMRSNFNLLLVAAGPILLPVRNTVVDHIASLTAEPDMSFMALVGGLSATGSDYLDNDTMWVLFATGERSASSGNATNRFRWLSDFYLGSDLSGQKLSLGWSPVYGSYTSGSRVFLRAKTVNILSGLASPWLTTSFVTI